MAIIPKGNFLKKKPSSVARPNLPSDGSAKPYHALAQMGDQMMQIGAEMYKRQRNDDIQTEANEALTKYSQRAAQVNGEMQNVMSDTGKVNDKNFSEAYTEDDEDIITDISGGLSTEANKLFKKGVASPSRSNRVNSIKHQISEVNKRYSTNFQRDTLRGASVVSLQDSDVNRTAYETMKKREAQLGEKLLGGMINEGKAADLQQHNGSTFSAEAAESSVTRRDVKEFQNLFGIDLLNSAEMKAYIKDNELETQEGKIRASFVAADSTPEMKELSNYLTPKQKMGYVRRMLSGMKQASTLSKQDLGIETRDLLAKIRLPTTDLHKELGEIRLRADRLIEKAESLDVSPAKIEVLKSQIEAEISVKNFNTDTAMVPPNQRRAMINNAPRGIRNDLGKFNEAQEEYVHNHKTDKLNTDITAMQTSPATYVYNNDADTRKAFNKVSIGDPRGLGRAIDKGILGQKKLGISKVNFQLAPDEVVNQFSKTINGLMQDENPAKVTKMILNLKEGLGEKLPMFMNELGERGGLEHKALAVASHIQDPVVLVNAIESLRNMNDNKGAFDVKNQGEKNRKNVDSIFTKKLGDRMDGFLSIQGRNSGRRATQLRTLVKARFYRNMRGKDMKEANDQMEKAYTQTISKMYIPINYGKSVNMIPRKHNIDTPTGRAAIKTLETQARNVMLSGRVNIKQAPAIYKQYKERGLSPKRMNQQFANDYINKIKVLSPADDSEKGVLRVMVQTDNGQIILPVEKGAFNDSDGGVMELPLEDVNSDMNTIMQKNKDSKGVLDFIFEKVDDLFGDDDEG